MNEYAYDIEITKRKIDKGIRSENRGFFDYRPITIETNIVKNANGSAKVTLGETIVYAGTKLEIGSPYPDSPDEGGISFNIELSPISAPEFFAGPPGEDAIELSRVVDRGIRESKAIDFKSLCIEEGEKALFIFVDIYVINHGGNLFDASSLAALAALKTSKLPKIDEENNIVKKEYEGMLKLSKMPFLFTFAKINNKILLDPDINETYSLDARLSVSYDGKRVCAFQKGGPGSFSFNELKEMVSVAAKKYKDMKKIMDKVR